MLLTICWSLIGLHLTLSCLFVILIWFKGIKEDGLKFFKTFDRHMVFVHLIIFLMPFQIVLIGFIKATDEIGKSFKRYYK